MLIAIDIFETTQNLYYVQKNLSFVSFHYFE
jgi:hypothetical protein